MSYDYSNISHSISKRAIKSITRIHIFFRVSAHRLEVETGRWHKPVAVPFNERKCRTCLNCLEDEFHFLLECPLYHELRKNIY